MAESKVKRDNYNKLYKQYYGIKFGRNYVVHHIDGNHDNNDMANLLLLPRWLHSQYHVLKAVIENHPLPTLIGGNQVKQSTYYLDYYERFIDTLKECNRWYDYKMHIDGKIPNIHGIKL